MNWAWEENYYSVLLKSKTYSPIPARIPEFKSISRYCENEKTESQEF